MLTLSAPGAYTVKWIAVDIKGNVSPVKSQRLLVAADDADGTVGGSVAGDALAHARHAGLVRRLHPGRGPRVHGVDDGHGHLDRR